MPIYTASATSAVNVAYGDASWNTGSGAPYPLNSSISPGQKSDLLRFGAFGFAVPAAATIVRIIVSFAIESYLGVGTPDETLIDERIEFEISGVAITGNLANGQTTGPNYTTWTYTTTGLTVSQVNNVNFGIQVAASNNGLANYRERIQALASVTIITAGGVQEQITKPGFAVRFS